MVKIVEYLAVDRWQSILCQRYDAKIVITMSALCHCVFANIFGLLDSCTVTHLINKNEYTHILLIICLGWSCYYWTIGPVKLYIFFSWVRVKFSVISIFYMVFGVESLWTCTIQKKCAVFFFRLRLYVSLKIVSFELAAIVIK